MSRLIASLALGLSGICLASGPPVTISSVFDNQIVAAERDIVPLADAMPPVRYNFAPKGHGYEGVRTYAQLITHIGTVIYEVSAATLEEKCPVDVGVNENGPVNLTTKPQILEYLTSAFEYAHKAMRSLTDENLKDLVASPFGSAKVPRASMAMIAVWHSFDIYGQMVEYARMNGIVPPASRH